LRAECNVHGREGRSTLPLQPLHGALTTRRPPAEEEVRDTLGRKCVARRPVRTGGPSWMFPFTNDAQIASANGDEQDQRATGMCEAQERVYERDPR
jgi:hypothetical protein